MDITKPDNDEGNLQPKYKDLQLQVSIPLERTQSSVIELGKVNPAKGRKDMPPPDSQEFAITTPVPDKETQAAAETLKSLQRHQGTDRHPENTSLFTPPGEVEYFEGRGLMESIRQSHGKFRRIHHSPATQQVAPDTPASLITTISVGIIPPASVGQRLDKSQSARRLTKHAANVFECHWQTSHQ